MAENDDHAYPDDAVGADGQPLFEATNGIRFLAAPEASLAHLPDPSPEEIAALRHVRQDFAVRAFTLRTRHARMLYTGRRPPLDKPGKYRIPGIPFAHFVLRGLLRRHAQIPEFDQCLANLQRHVNTITADLRRWRHKNNEFADRFLPVGTAPLYDHTTASVFKLESQIPSLMAFATAIAVFDRCFLEAIAITEVARDTNQWNHHFDAWKRMHGRIRNLLYAIVSTRKLGLPHPEDAPDRFTLMDLGPLPGAYIPKPEEIDEELPEPRTVGEAAGIPSRPAPAPRQQHIGDRQPAPADPAADHDEEP